MFRPCSLCSVCFSFFSPLFEVAVGLFSEIYLVESMRRVENVLVLVFYGLFSIWRTKTDSRRVFLFVAKVDLFLFVYIFRVITEQGRWVVGGGGWGMNKGIGVSSVQEWTGGSWFSPIAKQLLCLPGFHMFTESKGYIGQVHPFHRAIHLFCVVL